MSQAIIDEQSNSDNTSVKSQQENSMLNTSKIEQNNLARTETIEIGQQIANLAQLITVHLIEERNILKQQLLLAENKIMAITQEQNLLYNMLKLMQMELRTLKAEIAQEKAVPEQQEIVSKDTALDNDNAMRQPQESLKVGQVSSSVLSQKTGVAQKNQEAGQANVVTTDLQEARVFLRAELAELAQVSQELTRQLNTFTQANAELSAMQQQLQAPLDAQKVMPSLAAEQTTQGSLAATNGLAEVMVKVEPLIEVKHQHVEMNAHLQSNIEQTKQEQSGVDVAQETVSEQTAEQGAVTQTTAELNTTQAVVTGYDAPNTTSSYLTDFVSSGNGQNSQSADALDMDVVLTAVRKEVLDKQNDLFKEILLNYPQDTSGLHKIKSLSPEELRTLISQNQEYQEQIYNTLSASDEVGKNFKAKLEQIESAGYGQILKQFSSDFRVVDWQTDSNDNNIKSTTVKDQTGKVACNITERLIDGQQISVQLSDNTVVNVSAYRKIDFPMQLNSDAKGPMHIAMAVKDQNGNNIDAKDPVYFSVHYDAQGKMVEIIAPQPIKFAGQGKDAIGYIEKEGKVYTVPVTREQYQKMLQEVQYNQGHSIGIMQAEVQNNEISQMSELSQSPLQEQEIRQQSLQSQGQGQESSRSQLSSDPSTPPLGGVAEAMVSEEPRARANAGIFPSALNAAVRATESTFAENEARREQSRGDDSNTLRRTTQEKTSIANEPALSSKEISPSAQNHQQMNNAAIVMDQPELSAVEEEIESLLAADDNTLDPGMESLLDYGDDEYMDMDMDMDEAELAKQIEGLADDDQRKMAELEREIDSIPEEENLEEMVAAIPDQAEPEQADVSVTSEPQHAMHISNEMQFQEQKNSLQPHNSLKIEQKNNPPVEPITGHHESKNKGGFMATIKQKLGFSKNNTKLEQYQNVNSSTLQTTKASNKSEVAAQETSEQESVAAVREKLVKDQTRIKEKISTLEQKKLAIEEKVRVEVRKITDNNRLTESQKQQHKDQLKPQLKQILTIKEQITQMHTQEKIVQQQIGQLVRTDQVSQKLAVMRDRLENGQHPSHSHSSVVATNKTAGAYLGESNSYKKSSGHHGGSPGR